MYESQWSRTCPRTMQDEIIFVLYRTYQTILRGESVASAVDVLYEKIKGISYS